MISRARDGFEGVPLEAARGIARDPGRDKTGFVARVKGVAGVAVAALGC